MTNVQFIIQYLSEYPGSRYTDLTKALCAYKGKTWHRGYYVRYFTRYTSGTYNSNTGTYTSGTCYPDNIWYKSHVDGKWYLTSIGRRRIQPGGPTKLINFVQL